MNAAKAGTVRGIVLAGVHQWDESALDAVIPRPLLPVLHVPLISYSMNWLRAGGVESATLCANSASRDVRSCFGSSHCGLELDYYEDWTPRGPAGCVRDAGLACNRDVFVVADATIIPQTSLAGLLESHSRSNAMVTIGVDSRSTGELSSGGLWPVGLYVFSRAALSHIAATGYQDIKEILIPRLHRMGQKVVVHHVDSECPRVSDFESYLSVNAWLLEQITDRNEPPAGYERRGDALVHTTAEVARTARFIGRAIVGEHCRIGGGALIVGPVILNAQCQVAAGAVVCRSVLWDGCRIGRNALIDQSVVGRSAWVESGAELHSQYHAATAEDEKLDAAQPVEPASIAPQHELPAQAAAKNAREKKLADQQPRRPRRHEAGSYHA